MARTTNLAIAIALVASPVASDPMAEDEAAVLPRLIDSLCLDLHPEPGCERIFLLASAASGETADIIMLSGHSRDTTIPLLVARDVAFNGPFEGMIPSIERADDGRLLVQSEQFSFGRHPWFQTLTIGWSGSEMVVQHYAFSSYDRISNDGYTCDVDLMAGRYISLVSLFDAQTETDEDIREEGEIVIEPIPVAEWSAREHEITVCSAAANRFYAQ